MRTDGSRGPSVPFQSYHEGGEIILLGDVDTKTAQELFDTAFEQAYVQVGTRGLKMLTVDVVRLEFVNSSAVSVLTRWVLRAAKRGLSLRFVINPELPWQRMNFNVLRTMAPETVTIEEKRLS